MNGGIKKKEANRKNTTLALLQVGGLQRVAPEGGDQGK